MPSKNQYIPIDKAVDYKTAFKIAKRVMRNLRNAADTRLLERQQEIFTNANTKRAV